MSEKYKVSNQDSLYFVTFSVVQWIDLFTRPVYKDILVDNLKYCQKHKGLEIYAWCIMTNHIHLIVGRYGTNEVQDIIRDYKKYASVKLVREVEDSISESRQPWLLNMFREAAAKSSKHQKYKIWQSNYHPIELFDNSMMQQKLDYIHQNPVKAQIVAEPEHYLYSSALDYAGGKGLIPIKFIG